MKKLIVKPEWGTLPENATANDLIRQEIARAWALGHRYSFYVYGVGNGFAKTEAEANSAALRKARRACPANPPSWEISEMIIG